VTYSSLDEEQNKQPQRRKTMKNIVVEEGSEIRYVVTNPSKDLLLRGSDVVFVLA